MPGLNRSGPLGEGPMTGGGRGLCNPSNTGFAGGYNYGRDGGFGRGFGRGYGPGMGMRRGFGRGNQPAYDQVPQNEKSKIDMLKAEASYMKSTLDAINKQIDDLNKSS